MKYLPRCSSSRQNPSVPTIKIIGQFRFFFSSSDGSEPPHVHVQHERKVAKFWLDPVELAESGRLAPHQLNAIARQVERHRLEFIEAWHEHCGG